MTNTPSMDACFLSDLKRDLEEEYPHAESQGLDLITQRDPKFFEFVDGLIGFRHEKRHKARTVKKIFKSWAEQCIDRNWVEGLNKLVQVTKDDKFLQEIWDEPVVANFSCPFVMASGLDHQECVEALMPTKPDAFDMLDAVKVTMQRRHKHLSLLLWNEFEGSGQLGQLVRKQEYDLRHLITAASNFPDDALMKLIVPHVNPLHVMPVLGKVMSKESLDEGRLPLSIQTLVWWDRIFSFVNQKHADEMPDEYSALVEFFAHPTISCHTPLFESQHLKKTLLSEVGLLGEPENRKGLKL